MAQILPVQDFSLDVLAWDLTGGQQSGGVSLSGLEQVSYTTGGDRWACTFQPKVFSESLRKRWRSYRARLRGGSVAMEIPWNAGDLIGIAGAPRPAPHPHSDGTSFFDGTLYQIAPWVTGSFAEAAALRATSATIDFDQDVTVQGGEPFTVINADGARLHIIASIEARTANSLTITFDPPLRATVDTDTVLDFDNPRCLMRCRNPQQWNGVQSHDRILRPNVEWREYFSPQPAT